MRRVVLTSLLLGLAFLVFPQLALAHDAPENESSKWVMADWMIDTFFIFSGLALVAFVSAWKAGHFHDVESHGAIPLLTDDGDYYTPEWALDEEEWTDGNA